MSGDPQQLTRGGFFDLPPVRHCRHPGHEFPTMLYIPPGKGYRHVCPGCGKETVRMSPKDSLSNTSGSRT